MRRDEGDTKAASNTCPRPRGVDPRVVSDSWAKELGNENLRNGGIAEHTQGQFGFLGFAGKEKRWNGESQGRVL